MNTHATHSLEQVQQDGMSRVVDAFSANWFWFAPALLLALLAVVMLFYSARHRHWAKYVRWSVAAAAVLLFIVGLIATLLTVTGIR